MSRAERQTRLTIPADDARCLDGQCPARESCLRWRARLDTDPRAVFGEHRREPGAEKCENYWVAKEEETGDA